MTYRWPKDSVNRHPELTPWWLNFSILMGRAREITDRPGGRHVSRWTSRAVDASDAARPW